MLLLHFDNQSAYGENNTLFYDFSGKNRNGTCKVGRCPTFSLAGKIDKSVNMSVIEQAVYFPTGRELFNDDNWTLSMWTYLTTTAGTPVLLSRESAGDFYLQVPGGDYLYFNLYGTIGSSSLNSIVTNKWQHIVITQNITSIKFYIDNVDVTSDGTTAASTAVTDGLFFGRWQADGYGINGRMDEIAIWNRSLTTTEIASLYKRGLTKFNLSVRSCDDSACSGETFTYINTTNPQSLSQTDNRYFQYSTIFSTENLSYSPYLYNVSISYTTSGEAPTDSCTYSGAGDWYINPADNCILQKTDLSNNRIYINSTTSTNEVLINGTWGTTLYNYSTFTIFGTSSNIVKVTQRNL